MRPRTKKILLALSAVLVIAGIGALAFLHSLGLFASAPYFSTKNGAIDGYDPVAYFDQGRAVRGDPSHTLDWSGAEWKFSSADNLERFREDPARFAPAYGGYCAFGMARGYTARIDPEVWTIEAGRLYLNFDQSVQETWSKDRDGFIRKADQNWGDSRPARNAAEGP